MTTIEAIKSSRDHWRRMLRAVILNLYWLVENRNINGKTLKEICGESWSSDYCELCEQFICYYCPLGLIKGVCTSTRSPYSKVTDSKTWPEFIRSSERMIMWLNECLIAEIVKEAA